MDDHQRRIWSDMLIRIEHYRQGDLPAETLLSDLKGLLGASDLHDHGMFNEFWNHFAPVDGEYELLTESWAPTGSGSEARLAEALGEYERWVRSVLATTDDQRT